MKDSEGKGILYAVCCYTLWGLLPVYWKALSSIPAYEILCHRITWSFLLLILVLFSKSHWKWIRRKLKNRRTIVTFLGTSCLIGFNWMTFIWAVNSGYLVEASLGYFINPLISVLLGVLILREKIRIWQGVAVVVAVVGVLHMTINYGSFPWIALALAGSFGFYGLLRKTGSLNSIEGLTFETGMLFLPAFFLLLSMEFKGNAAFGHSTLPENLLLLLSGVVTAFPLLLFTAAARRIPLSTIGILQYIGPTFHFILGVFIYKEDFSTERLIGFIIIWIALLIYTLDGIFRKNKNL